MTDRKEKKLEKLVEKQDAQRIIEMITEKDVQLALKAAAALGKVKGNDDAYNMLITLLRSPMAQMRSVAVLALAEMGDQKARAHIDHNYLSEEDETVREDMRKAMTTLHSNE